MEKKRKKKKIVAKPPTIKQLKAELAQFKQLSLIQEKELQAARLLTDYDALTGLYNRRGFIQEANRFLNEVRFNGGPADKRRFRIKNFSIIFVDLDNLKKTNDVYGHKVGDQFIRLAAGVLKMHLREIDVVTRWGGDEFVIGLINVSEEEAVVIADKLRKKIEQINIPGVDIKFSASFGVISAKDKQHRRISNLYELIEGADMAMYEAKQAKKTQFYRALHRQTV
ncbi:MAG: GGDEF domain-containing protein [Candidatus Niyogibacteria bacterium]|nr:GGDEF domain-containing protein [Candidatus Niyogibacteria bacterium]